MPQRNVTITPYQERFIEAALQSGQFGNTSEVFRAALRLLEREQQQRIIEKEIMNQKIDRGIEAYKAGDYTEVNNQDELDAFFEDMRKERKQALEAQG